jgi:ABC-type sugar transport system substrate-binding protein
MKPILSAAALLAALSMPAFADEAATASEIRTTGVIVPAVAEPPMSEGPAAAADKDLPHSTAKKSGGCGSKETVYLTN